MFYRRYSNRRFAKQLCFVCHVWYLFDSIFGSCLMVFVVHSDVILWQPGFVLLTFFLNNTITVFLHQCEHWDASRMCVFCNLFYFSWSKFQINTWPSFVDLKE